MVNVGNKVLAIILFSLLIGSNEASATVVSRAVIDVNGTVTDSDSIDAGVGQINAEESDSGDVPDGGASRSYSASATSSAINGRLYSTLSSGITNAATGTTAPVIARNTVIDTFTIGAGGGLSNGDAARVCVEIVLDGSVQIGGVAAGGSAASLTVSVNADNTEQAIYNSGALSPPQDFEVHKAWHFLMDVTVGGNMLITASMITSLGATEYAPGPGTNTMEFGPSDANDPMIRVHKVPGYDSLVITSEAGATVSDTPSLLCEQPFPWELFLPAIIHGSGGN